MNIFLKNVLVPAVAVCTALWLAGCNGGDESKILALETDAPAQWNAIVIQAIATAGAPPIPTSRIAAMAFSAGHDALNAIDPRYKAYLTEGSEPNANPDAAVAAAIFTVMKTQLPDQGSYLDGQYAIALAKITEGQPKTTGIALGQRTAQAILAARANDGAGPPDQPPYVFTAGPGVYEPTPPINQAFFVGWGAVKPFALTQASQFRAAPPNPVLSTAYVKDYNETRDFGGATSAVRSGEQAQIAKFWLQDTHMSWNRIAAQVAKAKGMNGWDQMRLFTLMQLAQADTYISMEEAKYLYRSWRPITAIRKGDLDGNADTLGDATWTPFDPVTPPDPEYPSGHAMSGGAGEAVMQAVFGADNVTFTETSSTLPNVTRTYASFSQAGAEMGLSRIYVGYHFRNSVEQGRKQGQQIGAWAAAQKLGKR